MRLEDFDYLCKLDMDLDLPVRYFELLMQRMESNPRVGTTSGKPWFLLPQSGALVPEICGDEMSVGMTKVLSRRLLQGIWTGRLRAGFGQYFMGITWWLHYIVYRLTWC